MKKLFLIVAYLVSGATLAAEVALVMSAQGRVTRQAEIAVPVESFVKLRAGDRIDLSEGARLQLVYFDSGRQETWAGSGSIQVDVREGKGSGLPPPEVKTLPLVMARQIARTPTLDAQGRAGVTRLRTIKTDEAMLTLEKTYQELKGKAASDDIGPEVYLLSGLFDMRELDRVEKLVGTLQKDWPTHPEAKLLASLYRKALKNAREANGREAVR